MVSATNKNVSLTIITLDNNSRVEQLKTFFKRTLILLIKRRVLGKNKTIKKGLAGNIWIGD